MKYKNKYINLSLVIAGLWCSSAALAAGSVLIDDNWVATNGSIVTGTFTGTVSTPAIKVTTKKPVTIQNATVTGTGNLIFLSSGSNVTVKNTQGIEINSNVAGQVNGSFVMASSVASLIVKNCTASGIYYGVYVLKFSGNKAAGQTIKILNNVFNNIDSRASDGKGGYTVSGRSISHAIILNGVQAVPNIEIAWNQIISTPFKSLVEDVINVYQSSGTQSSHLLIHDNYIQGAMGASPGNGEKYSGGGIITDGTATDTALTTPAWVDIYNNQVVMTANYGVAVASGHDVNIYNNRVVSAGRFSTGIIYAMTFGTGAYNWSSHSMPKTVFYNNHVHDNVLGLIRPNTSGVLNRSDWYLPGQTTTENNQHLLPNDSAHPTPADEQNEFVLWQQKLKTNGISIGAQQNTGTIALTVASGSDAGCAAASDTLYLDGSITGIPFKVSAGTKQTLAAGAHTLALASSSAAIPAGDGTAATCSGSLSNNSVSIAAGMTRALTVSYKYLPAVTTGTLSLKAASGSDSRCAAAIDTLYLDGLTSGKKFTVSSGVTQTLPTGTHTLALASAATAIPAGNGQNGTCSSILSASKVTISAGQAVNVTAGWQYTAASRMACAMTASLVNSVQLWDVKVDGFYEEVTMTGFPTDANGNIIINGSFVMKNNFKINFWSNQAWATSFIGNTGKFTGSIYGKTGSTQFSLGGYLIDGTPVIMKVGDHPLQSLTINGISCTIAFPLRQGGASTH